MDIYDLIVDLGADEMVNKMFDVYEETLKKVDPVLFFAIIGCIIDYYCSDHGLDTMEMHKNLYKASIDVYNELGDA